MAVPPCPCAMPCWCACASTFCPSPKHLPGATCTSQVRAPGLLCKRCTAGRVVPDSTAPPPAPRVVAAAPAASAPAHVVKRRRVRKSAGSAGPDHQVSGGSAGPDHLVIHHLWVDLGSVAAQRNDVLRDVTACLRSYAFAKHVDAHGGCAPAG